MMLQVLLCVLFAAPNVLKTNSATKLPVLCGKNNPQTASHTFKENLTVPVSSSDSLLKSYNITLANCSGTYTNNETMIYLFLKTNKLVLEFKQRHHKLFTILIISGDISLNPGPKYPCGKCSNAVASNHRALLCEACYYWTHIQCANISPKKYIELGKSDDPWICNNCLSCPFSDSFFDIEEVNTDVSSISVDENVSVFEEIQQLRKSYPNKFMLSHLNINSLKSKFDEIRELFCNKIVDLMFLSETKLDPSYRNSLFETPGYKLERKDRNSNGGGIAAFIRTEIPARRRADLENKTLENMIFEVILNKSKWCIICIYRPPNMKDSVFSKEFSKTLDHCITLYDNYMLIGDMNYDLLNERKGKTLLDLIDIFDLKNLIKEPTCHMKNCTGSLIDVILTNSKNLCMKTLNVANGISDCHNMISTIINNTTPTNEKQKIKYRSFKSVNIESLNADLAKIQPTIPSSVPKEIYSNEKLVDQVYEKYETDICNVFDQHVPIKEMYVKNNKLPYMNRELRKAIYDKKMLYTKYLKNKNSKNWEKYRIKRNLVNKMKKKDVLEAVSKKIFGKL